MKDRVLYRFFDVDGGLLYVGKSVRAWDRFAAHRTGSAFYPEAAQVTLQRGFKSDRALAKAEVAAIRSERPRFNIQHKPGPTRKPTRLDAMVPNPCGCPHYCGPWVHVSAVCQGRDESDLAIVQRVDAGEPVAAIAADVGCRGDYIETTHERIRKQQAEGCHGCWECPGRAAEGGE
jgi:hypothetical protein